MPCHHGLRAWIAHVANVDDSGGATALAKASELGQVALVKENIETGANVDFGGLEVPLCNEAYSGHAAIAEMLLSTGTEEDA